MLVLDEPLDVTLRDRFHEERVSVRERSEHPLLSRWGRAVEAGVRADALAHPEGVAASELQTRRERLQEVFREESALLGPIASDFASRSLVAIVADSEGVIVSAHGGGAFVETAARTRLVEGASWAESVRGTNAIGTALVEGGPVAVVGGAHFELRNSRLFCYASPVRDAYGEIVCALDVTGAMQHHDRSVGVAVKAAAMGLERALRMRAFATSGMGGLPVIERLVSRCSTPAFLVEATGDVRVINETARAVLGQSGSLDCRKIFGVGYRDLVRLAVSNDVGRFETPRATYRVELDTVSGSRGALAVLVYLEPQRTKVESTPPRPKTTRPAHPAFGRILGSDPALERAKTLSAKFAATDLPVLLLAETGTGKELFARALHDASPRCDGPFVALNCGSFTTSLLESELFGHAPGSFTGASRRGAEGKIAAADGGTLFLDEIAEMPEPLQAALLRLLDDGVYYRVGDAKPRRANFRLVGATCRDLPALVTEGRFRRDLFYRIHGASLFIPALRDRSDRVELASGLLHQMTREGSFDEDAIAWIEEHSWPGNVRELKSAITHAVALAEDGVIRREDFPEVLLTSTPLTSVGSTPPVSSTSSADQTRDAIFRAAAEDAVRAASGNLSEAARRLGVARSTLYRALRRST